MPSEEILNGYRRFQKRYQEQREKFRELEDGQQPPLLWIGCSDSRVAPELLLDAAPGEVFVVRNVAALVPPYQSGAGTLPAAVDYAVEVLGCRHAVVCGHSCCGGLAALASGLREQGDTALADWLRHACDAREGEGERELTRRNTLLQLERLGAYPSVAGALAEGRFSLHAWIYDLRAGKICAFRKETGDWRELNTPADLP